MLRIINGLVDCGKTPSVEQYMTIFLKFVQSVIPTIEYDFTSDVVTGGAWIAQTARLLTSSYRAERLLKKWTEVWTLRAFFQEN